MQNLIFRLTVFSFITSIASAQSFTDPADKLIVRVSPSITLTSGIFKYDYLVVNQRGPEVLKVFSLETCDDHIANMHGPQNLNWTSGLVVAPSQNVSPQNYCGHNIFWTVKDKYSSLSDLRNSPPSALRPGQSMHVGYSSNNLPTIKRFWAEGWVPPPTESNLLNYYNQISGQNYPNLDAVPQNIATQFPGSKPWFVNAFQGQTVAPDKSSINQTDPISLIQRLISLKEQAASLGWIGGGRGRHHESDENEGVVKSLDKKLEHALQELKEGEKKEAAEILKSFINELDALHGEGDNEDGEDHGDQKINDGAYSLLKANAEFILAMLPKPGGEDK